MPTFTDKLTYGTIAFFTAIFVSFGQASLPAPDSNPDQQTAAKAPPVPSTNPAKSADKSASAASPLTVVQATSTTSTPAAVKPAPPQPSTSTPATTTVPPVPADTVTESGGVGVREFQGDDVGQVLRLLARQAKINMVVSDQVTGTVKMQLEDVTPLKPFPLTEKAKGLFMDRLTTFTILRRRLKKRPSRPKATAISSATRAQKKLRLCWHHNFQAKIPLNSTSAPTPFSSVRPAATSTLCASCW